MSMPWFRLYSEFSGDPIIQSLAFEDQRHFVMILCLKCNGLLDRKIVPSRRGTIIARALGLDIASAEEAQRRLIEVDLIDNKWQPKKWNDRQYISDNSTERVRKYRKTKEIGNVPKQLQDSYSNGPETETEADTDKDINTSGENAVSTQARPQFKIIVDKWNVMAERIGLPQTVKITTSLKGQIRQRCKDLPDEKNWDNFFDYIENNEFLAGNAQPGPNRSEPFRATLLWVTKEGNFAKIAAKEYR